MGIKKNVTKDGKVNKKKGLPTDKAPSMKKLEHPGKDGIGKATRDVKLKKSNPLKKVK